jgi:predicted AAA+ superfamily ATPase
MSRAGGDRDRHGAEVDLIVEDDGGSIAGIQVKAASTMSSTDAKHLQGLREKLRDRFTAGVVLYLGDRVVSLGERIWALPVSILWAD